MDEVQERQAPEVIFTPTYHKGSGGAAYYALPGKRGGTSRLTNERLGERCWTVYREALALNSLGAFNTFDEADDAAAALALDEELADMDAVQRGNPPGRAALYLHLPGRVCGMLYAGEDY